VHVFQIGGNSGIHVADSFELSRMMDITRFEKFHGVLREDFGIISVEILKKFYYTISSVGMNRAGCPDNIG